MKNLPNASKNRRQFIKKGILAGAMLPFIANPALSLRNSLLLENVIEKEKDIHPLKILILGGTSFLGLHQIKLVIRFY